MKKLSKFLIGAISLFTYSFTSCAADVNSPSSGTNIPRKLDPNALNVLFVGNSMTYYNTLCDVFKGIASQRGHRVKVKAATTGGQNLVYQSTAKNVKDCINSYSWDVIVFQDIVGGFKKEDLDTGAKECIELARTTSPDAKIVLYEPWPTKDKILGENSLLEYFTSSYIKTARKNNAELAPAAEAFYDIYKYYGLDYYCSDNKHPQPLGTFISASTIYYTIFDEEPCKNWTSDDQSYIDNLINSKIAHSDNQGKQDSYAIEKLNLINELGYHYAHAVKDAVHDKTKEYKSALFGSESASKVELPEENPGNENIPDSTPDETIPLEKPEVTLANPDADLYASKSENLALKTNSGTPQGYASSNLRGAGTSTPLIVGNLNDGNKSSYIIANTTAGNNSPWFAVDLKTAKTINKVVVTPGAGSDYSKAYPVNYEIQVAAQGEVSNASSVPNLDWQTVATVKNGTAAALSVTFESTQARWIRVLASSYADHCSLMELEAFAPNTDVNLEDVEPHKNILFIGNSYTYYNNLSGVVEGISNYRGHDVSCQAATNGGKNLIFQSTAENVVNTIKSQEWDLVVLQDHISSFDANNLLTGSAALIELIKKTSPNAEFLYYVPCPRKNAIMTRMKEFTNGYMAAAKKYNAKMAPCGEAYYDAYVYHGQDNYNSDELHPTPMGTFIMASTIYYTMYPEEEKVEWTNKDYSSIYDIIKRNWAYSDRGMNASYELSALNLYNDLAYYYSHAILPALESNERYTSVVDKGQSASDRTVEAEVSNIHIERTVNGTKYLSFSTNLASKTAGAQGYSSSNGRNGNGIKTVGFLNDGQKNGTYYIVSNVNGYDGTAKDTSPWFAIDLGSVKEFNKIVITPGADSATYPNASPVEYSVQIVKENATAANPEDIPNLKWETVATVTGGDEKPLSLTIVTEKARWVRVLVSKWGTNCALYELEVFAPDTSKTL